MERSPGSVSGFDRRYQVKQYVGEVEGSRATFRVFKTGDDRWYLFCTIDRDGCDVGVQFPVRKTDLHPEVKRALAHGYSFSMPAYERLVALVGGRPIIKRVA